MLTRTDVGFFWEHGYLRIPKVYDETELAVMSGEMDRLMREWAIKDLGWTGDWRREYMDPATEKKSQLIAMHDLWYYSAVWMRAVTHPRLVAAMVDLLGPNVELHHSTMHVKPPESGQPFPMHQDSAFYEHPDNRYIDVLVHLDDTRHENGEIRFLDGSHKQGHLPHITRTRDGNPCSPHLPTDRYKLADTVAVPAQRGDVVCFNIFTIHGSHLNQTDHPRRLVRVGYRHPDNRQTSGQSFNRPSWMVAGQRLRREGDTLFKQE